MKKTKLADLHIHTIASGDAFHTINEVTEHARLNNLSVIAITDHGPASPASKGEYYFGNLSRLPMYINSVRVLKGVEANILNINGELDLKDEIIGKLDYVIASLHNNLFKPMSKLENTSAVMNALSNRYVDCIGHPDKVEFDLDLEIVARHAGELNKCLELNSTMLKKYPNVSERTIDLILYAKKYNVKLALGSDAHVLSEIADFDNSIKLLHQLSYPLKNLLNHDLQKIMSKSKVTVD